MIRRVFILCVCLPWHAGAMEARTTDQTGLKIVVIAGEDAINIIQQKTATAPVIEVRDRNDLPVSSAAVTFAIQGSNTTFAGGVQTLTLTTDAAGRAVVGTLNPLGRGAFQINVQAAFQGQTASATIAQTNVMTAAEAAAVSGSGAAAGGTASGGLSNAAIAGIAGGAGAAALGTLVLTKDSTESGPSGQTSTSYTGPYGGQGSMTFTTSTPNPNPCVHTRELTGVLSLALQQSSDGTVTGMATTTSVETTVAVSAACSPQNMVIGFRQSDSWSAPVTGTAQGLRFSQQTPYTSVPFGGGSVAGSRTLGFSGALTGSVVSGTMTLVDVANGTSGGGGLLFWNGSTTLAVTLR